MRGLKINTPFIHRPKHDFIIIAAKTNKEIGEVKIALKKFKMKEQGDVKFI